ncbi:pentatricopeptide repeat-containing protein At5g48910-like isoform X2 [Wolffia australiana]
MLLRTSSGLPPAMAELKGCRSVRELRQHHAAAVKAGSAGDALVAAEILRAAALSDDRDLRYAELVFSGMGAPNLFSWNTMIRAFSESEDRAREGLLLYCRMLNLGVDPNKYTLPSVLKACAAAGAGEEARQVHAQALKMGLENDGFVASNLLRAYAMTAPTIGAARKLFATVRRLFREGPDQSLVVLCNTMIDGLMHRGMVDEARKMFEEMPHRSVVSWNAIIAGYAQNGQAEAAVEMFRAMEASVAPNQVTLLSVLPAISHLGDLELGERAHAYAAGDGVRLDDALGSALVDMYAKCGSIDKAREVFDEIPKRNPVAWSAMIGGLAVHGLAGEAVELFERMEKDGVVPTEVTFLGLLKACSHGGLVDQGRLFFKRMEVKYRIKPRIEHYGCVVDMLARAGLVEEAERVLLSMPFPPDDVVLKALLSACKLHGETEIGRRLAARLVELSPEDGGSFVLLSNLYASLGDWDAMARVRLRMKEMGIRKDPGRSWITVNGVVHGFVVEDDAHERKEEIYGKLEEVVARLRAAGHSPETKAVLLNVDDEEKETALRFHSEKIALAFGLISTSPGKPLRIVKNLRVCGDCHESFKLISEIYGRRILLRDRSRFHHFEAGLCSCNDF